MKFLLVPIAAIAFVSVSCTKNEQNASAISSLESATKPYPLETCIVADEALGSMGDPVVIVYEGREIKFCCDSCRPKFEADPAKYLAKLEHANHNH